METRWKLITVMLVAVACAFVIAGCAPQTASSASASSASQAGSSAVESSSSAQPSAPGVATIDLDYSAGTGFEWDYAADPEGIVELVSKDTESLASGAVSGGPLQDHFTFRASKAGEVVLTFELTRPWEPDGTAAETQVYAFTVNDDLQMILNPYKSDFDNEPTIGADS